MSITHAIYLVSDADQAVDFLAEIFRLSVQADDVSITGDRFLTMGNNDALHLQIVEHPNQTLIAQTKRQTEVVDFIFQTDDIQKMVKRVKDYGLKVLREPVEADYGCTAIFEDPFGNLWDLIQR
ncbi:MAG: VOC family protein [Pseudomonadales bacterium]|nr:VOC family protein [Pseudomonadales bacterium]MBO6565336.1 VOC family protein [Pseudomonadales bacterium]MBO6596718.1 VOC family protein [Pseudomonadales bacterium]MBO6656019.1 VOC family protein [Pseudomonadales bacterium]MBO6703389.1 VOC family protein [Pseudomonadales bacterium]